MMFVALFHFSRAREEQKMEAGVLVLADVIHQNEREN